MISKILKVFLVLLPLLSSGCVVASSMVLTESEKNFYAGHYDQFIENAEHSVRKQGTMGCEGIFSPEPERARAWNEIFKWESQQNRSLSFSMAFEIGSYTTCYWKYVTALIETGNFEKANAICEEGIKYLGILTKIEQKRGTHSSNVGSKICRLYTLKGILAYLKSGDASLALKIFDMAGTWVSNDNDLEKMDYLISRADFCRKIGDNRGALEIYNSLLGRIDQLSLLKTDIKFGLTLETLKKLFDINVKLGELEEAKIYLDKYKETEKSIIWSLGSKMFKDMEIIRGFYSTMEATAGAAFALQRDFKTSKEYFDRSKKMIDKFPVDLQLRFDRDGVGAYHVLYGTYFLGLQGRYREAADYVDKGITYLRLYYSYPSEVDIESAYNYSSELHYLLKNYDTAINQATKAIKFAQSCRNNTVIAKAYTLLGQIYYSKGEIQKSKNRYEKALELARKIESTENWKLFYGLGKVYEDLGNENEALKYYKKAIDEIEKLWNGRFKDTQKQVSFIDNRLVVFEPVIRLLARQGKAEETLQVMERSKSRTFFETNILNVRQSQSPEEVKANQEATFKIEKIQSEISTVKEKIDALNQRLGKNLNVNDVQPKTENRAGVKAGKSRNQPSQKNRAEILKKDQKASNNQRVALERELAAYQKKLESLSAEEQRLRNELGQKAKDFTTNTLTSSQIRDFIPQQTAILEYYVGEKGIVGVVINKKGTYAKELPLKVGELKKTVMTFREKLEEIDPEYKIEGRMLYDQLVKPFKQYLSGSDSIIIVSHGVLHYLPFQALIVSDDTEQKLDPGLREQQKRVLAQMRGLLVQSRGIVIKGKEAASPDGRKTTFAQLRDQLSAEYAKTGSKRERPRFLVDEFKLSYAPSSTILNAVHQANKNEKSRLLSAGSPPEVDIKDLGLRTPDEKGIEVAVESLPKLVSAKEEILEVSTLFTDKTVFTDETATMSAVVKNAPDKDVLHFAAHGLLIRKNPLKSCIFFNKGKEDNGRLTVKEIEALKLRANLAVLSACETGLVAGYEGMSEELVDAKFPLGDDLVGLQRAFLKAGTSSVLSTLWQVADDATSKLVVDFIQRYRNGIDKTTALREAQLSLMRSNEVWEHPYFWAPFVLTGDWR